MKKIYTLTKLTILHLLSEKIFYLFLFFSIAALLLSYTLGQLTYTDHAYLTLNLLIGSLEITTTLFAIFITTSLIKQNLSFHYIPLILSRPVPRSLLILSQWLGLTLTTTLITLLLHLSLWLISILLHTPLYPLPLIQNTLLLSLQASLLIAFQTLLSYFLSPILSVISGISLYITGHSLHTLKLKNPSPLYPFLKTFIPNLELFNMKSLLIQNQILQCNLFILSFLYGMIFCIMLLLVAAFVIQRKDFTT